MSVPIRNIRWPQDRAALMEHIRLVHGPGDIDLLQTWYGGFPGFDPADCFVIEADDGSIAAHTMLIPRQFQIGVAHVPASEIGVVGTLETHRGRGYARALLERALARMSERGDALGMILGIPNFYERWGYEYAVGLYLTSYESSIDTEHALQASKWDLGGHSYHRRMAAFLGMRGREVIVRPFGLSDLPVVRDLYSEAARQGHYLMARSDAAWEWQLRFLADIGRYEPDDFLVAEVDGEVVAYARVISHGQVNWFLEAEAARFSLVEAAGDDADATEALLGAVAQLARTYNAERIGVFVHPESQMMRHVLAHGGAQRAFTGAGFLRIHDLPLLMTRLAPTFERRLASTPAGGYGIRLVARTEDAEGEAVLGDGAQTIRLEAAATDLVRLVTGWFGIDDLPQAAYNPRYKLLLRAMFPKRDPRISLTDIL